MTWPTPQDYNEAIQLPQVCFADADLQAAHPELTPLGLPRPNSGAFASVYKMSYGQRHWAVRCFLRNVANQHDRYRKISDFILSDELPYTVDFAYLEKGINIHGNWYPILKMDWVDGRTLDSFVHDRLNDRAALDQLVVDFRQMHADLLKYGIAHGDLQHGNIIVTPAGELRLVDYDGMFVPALAGEYSNEIGHPNYQHPQRTGTQFDATLDNFSCWVIEVSLRALARDPSLADRFNACDDSLLFRRNDFLYPAESPAFYFLERHADEQIQRYARWLRIQVQSNLAAIGDLPEILETLPALQTQAPSSSAWYLDDLPTDQVDWRQLKQFYAEGNLPRPLFDIAGQTNLPERQGSVALHKIQSDLLKQHKSLFGVQYLHYKYASYSSPPIWFFAAGVLFCTYNVAQWFCMVACTVLVVYIVWVIRLRRKFARAAKVVRNQLPVDVVLQFTANSSTIFLQILRAPRGLQHLRGKHWTFEGNNSEFVSKFGESGSVRVDLFADPKSGPWQSSKMKDSSG